MKGFQKLFCFVLACIMLVTPALGVDSSKTANFDVNSTPPSGFNLFHPTSGYIIGYYDSDYDTMSTRVRFSYTATAVANINAYNDDDKYTGVDVKDVGNAFSAYSITSTAPNVKTDIETNSGHDYYNEAEIVILGQLTAGTNYDMSVSWYDYRQGYLSDRFAVNAELSNKPLLPGLDYNVVSGGWKTLASLYYGKTAGYP